MEDRLFVRERRKAAGLSLRSLATISGVSFTTIDKIERGTQDPRLSTLIAFAKALEISVPDLFSPPPKRRRGKKK